MSRKKFSSFNFTPDDAVELWTVLKPVVEKFHGIAENYYSSFYGLLQENLPPKKFVGDITQTNILLSEVGNYISMHLSNKKVHYDNPTFLSDCNWARTQNHLVRKRTLSHLASLASRVFVYELSDSGFESSCSHLNFRFSACYEQGVPWHSANYSVWIHSKTRTWHDKNIQSNTILLNFLRENWKAYNKLLVMLFTNYILNLNCQKIKIAFILNSVYQYCCAEKLILMILRH